MENAPTGALAPDLAASPAPGPQEPSVAEEGHASSAAASPTTTSIGKLPSTPVALPPPSATASTHAAHTTEPSQPALPLPAPASPELSGAAVPPQLDIQPLETDQVPSATLPVAAPAQSSAPGVSSATTAALPSTFLPTAVPAPAATKATAASAVVFQLPQQQARSNAASNAAGAAQKAQKAVPSRAVTGGEQLAGACATMNNKLSAKKPLTLLELPMDILRLIVKEVTHTNDLTALARTNSTLYKLAIPHIYSRFDIVWPDPDAPVSEGKSVDALTYGLSTLCLGSAFARTAHRLRNDLHRGRLPSSGGRRQTNFGTADYAKHIRKFSLGNGPPDWVAEYMITKESGKMLGTLVALCVAKMRNLENFVWDMPTGVVSDVFMALASLPDYDEEHGDCKLDRLWIRWHNNSLTSPPGTPSTHHASIGSANQPTLLAQAGGFESLALPGSVHPPPRAVVPYSASKVEFPTFSVVPPLRSLTVLDIDEIAYLDEMAVLIERSKSRLTELRVGIAPHAVHKDFVQTWDGDSLQQVDLNAHWPGENTIGNRRLGGVFGILVGRICDISRKHPPRSKFAVDNAAPEAAAAAAAVAAAATAPTPATPVTPETPGTLVATATPSDSNEIPPASLAEAGDAAKGGSVAAGDTSAAAVAAAAAAAAAAVAGKPSEEARATERSDSGPRPERLNAKLKLTVLELERVPVSIQAVLRAIDWTTMTTLTILSCPSYDNLWRQLRKHFRPTATADHIYGSSAPPPLTSYARGRPGPLRYGLALKSIHTDQVSKALLMLIKETLAPHSLEVLFLQSRRRADSVVPTIQEIFDYAVRPHRASLRKLLIDGKLRRSHNASLDNQHRHASWTIPTTMLSYLSSGRMTKLRELAMSIHQHDWHPFVQRLPNLAQLRSLHIQHIADPVSPVVPYDLAMQIADVVTLRPEVQLCFVGMQTKCYEVVEVPSPWGTGSDGDRHGNAQAADGFGGGEAAADSIDGSADGDTLTSSSDEDEDEADDNDEDDDGGDDSNDDDDGGDGGDDDDNDDDDSNDGEDQDTTGAGAGGTHAAHVSAGGWNDSVSDTESLAEGGSGSGGRRRATPQFRMREIFFYDDKVAIFKARHGRL